MIGKHVGDGATGSFLSEDFDSESATARAAVEAANEVAISARRAATGLAIRVGLPRPARLSPPEGLRVLALGGYPGEPFRVKPESELLG